MIISANPNKVKGGDIAFVVPTVFNHLAYKNILLRLSVIKIDTKGNSYFFNRVIKPSGDFNPISDSLLFPLNITWKDIEQGESDVTVLREFSVFIKGCGLVVFDTKGIKLVFEKLNQYGILYDNNFVFDARRADGFIRKGISFEALMMYYLGEKKVNRNTPITKANLLRQVFNRQEQVVGFSGITDFGEDKNMFPKIKDAKEESETEVTDIDYFKETRGNSTVSYIRQMYKIPKGHNVEEFDSKGVLSLIDDKVYWSDRMKELSGYCIFDDIPFLRWYIKKVSRGSDTYKVLKIAVEEIKREINYYKSKNDTEKILRIELESLDLSIYNKIEELKNQVQKKRRKLIKEIETKSKRNE